MTAQRLTEIYLDYKNNFLTVGGYASYYGISESLAYALITEARALYVGIYA